MGSLGPMYSYLYIGTIPLVVRGEAISLQLSASLDIAPAKESLLAQSSATFMG